LNSKNANGLLKRIGVFLSFCLPLIGFAQLSVTATGTDYLIDFDQTVTDVNNGSWDGSSPQSSPASGDLDADAWNFTPSSGFSGMSTGSELVGGWYAFEVATNNTVVGAQPSGSFDAHSAELTLVNNTGAVISGFTIHYRLYAGFSESRDATITLTGQSGTNNTLDETTDNIISAGVSSGSWNYMEKNLVITNVNLAAGGTYTLAWSSDRGSGSGSSDEWGLDSIVVNAAPSCNPSSVTSFTPTSATVGQTITINGTGFGVNTTAVEIGGVAASSFTVVSATQITATVGAGASSGDVQVTTDGCTEIQGGFTYLVCIPQTITGFTPVEGSEGTWVTITGSDFTSGTGTDSVWMGRQPATIISSSSTELVVEVPASMADSTITVRTDNCPASTGQFGFIESTPCASNLISDLIISELYDANSGSLSYVEIYNGTGSAVDLSTYTIRIFSNGNSSPNAFCTGSLSGTLENDSVIIYSFGGTSTGALASSHLGNCGINENDCVQLLNNGTAIDVVGACDGSVWPVGNAPGYSYIRNSSITSPTTTFSESDWSSNGTSFLDSLGDHTFNQGPPPIAITSQPLSDTVCDGDPVMFLVTSSGTGQTYAWKQVTPATTTFTTLSNGGIYSGTTSATLSLSAATVTEDQYQFFVEITSGSCVLRSRAVQLTVEAKPSTSTVFHN